MDFRIEIKWLGSMQGVPRCSIAYVAKNGQQENNMLEALVSLRRDNKTSQISGKQKT